MGEKLPPNELALYRATDEVLHYIWDPIGIAGSAHARDEYYGYLPKVYSLLREGKLLEIRSYLLEIEESGMGLEERAEKTNRLNRTMCALLEWKEKCENNSDPSPSSE